MATIRIPPHPGKAVREACLDASGLSVTDSAKVLGVTRQALSNLINGKTGISPEMAIRLSKGFGGTPDKWIGMQAAYDLAQALKNEKHIRVQRHEPRTAA
jgi:addiction module HigA family antidote